MEGGRAAGAGRAAGVARVAASAIRLWAIGGGLVMAAVAVMTALSAGSNLAFSAPFPADYELVKHLTAVAIFMFLPYCQLAGANVTVDIFTERANEGAKAAMALLSALFAIAFALLLLRQMSLGWQSYLRYPEVTPVLRLPLWTAFPPILLSLLLLAVAALITAGNGIAVMRKRPPLTTEAAPAPLE